ncbi:MAG: Crp/Fnr family transcriptional regulator, partial [Dehalococcoidia bacterium]|nr:Crp/Fnr family transcriptional regulator [Dehalococcoidia bacterium]
GIGHSKREIDYIMTKLEFLQTTPLFAGMALPNPDTISCRVFEKKVPRGEIVFLEGDICNTLFIVAEGVVKLFKTSIDGKEQIISFVRPKELFNIVSVFDNKPVPVNAQALGAVTLYGLTGDDLNAVMRDFPEVSQNIIRVQTQSIHTLVSLVEDLSFRSVISRVAKILLENLPDPSNNSPKRLTQREMAAMAGTAREVVARSLKYLEGAGIIEMRNHCIAIRSRKGLEQVMELGL